MNISPELLTYTLMYEEYLQDKYAENKARQEREARIRRVEEGLTDLFAGVDKL